MGNLEPKCVFKRVLVDRHTIDDFYIYQDERRKIRRGKVLEMVANFDKPDKLMRHFDSPLVVNAIVDKRNVVDGNHRVDAICEKLKRDPDFKIVVTIAEYKNLTREEERQVYTKWNKGTPETATDYLKIHYKTIPYGKQMLREMPVEIYGTDTKITIKLVVGSHINAKKQNAFEGGYSYGGEKTVQDFMTIVPQDIRTMVLWFDYMKEIFGTYYKGHPFYRSTPVSVLYRIWYDNKDYIPREKFVNVWKAVFAQKLAMWDGVMKNGGRSASIFFYDLAMKTLTSYRRRLHWRFNLLDTPVVPSIASMPLISGSVPFSSKESEEEEEQIEAE